MSGRFAARGFSGRWRLSDLNRLITYWRSSLADAGRVSPATRDLHEIDRNEHRLSFTEFAEGKIKAEVAEQLFRAWRNKRLEEDKGVEPDQIPVTVYPLVFGKRYSHGAARDERVQRLYVPISIVAKLAKDGDLEPADQEAMPIVARELMEPSGSDIVIGTLEAADVFYSEHSSPTESWEQAVQFAHELVEAVSGQTFEALSLEGTERRNYGLVTIERKPPQSRNIIDAYDLLLRQDTMPPLLGRLTEGVDDEGLLESDELTAAHAAHLGQMTDGFALSPSQREALIHCLSAFAKPAEVLAVNGPPGTGKTTLIQSMVATLWVKAAVDKTDCPIIVAAGATNQSVTNVIESFGPIDSGGDDPLSGHWVTGVEGLGLFMPSRSARKKSWQTYEDVNDHFARPLETAEALERNRIFFLQRFAKSFPEQPAGELIAQSLAPEHSMERPHHDAIIDKQPGGRDAKGEA